MERCRGSRPDPADLVRRRRTSLEIAQTDKYGSFADQPLSESLARGVLSGRGARVLALALQK